MFNFIGKALVVFHTMLSLLLLTWAASLYLNATDWGWVNPRVELDQRIASEFDKSVVVLNEAAVLRDRALVRVPPAQAALREAENQFPRNRLWYVAELTKLRTGQEPIEVKAVEGPVTLDTPGKAIGKPVLDTTIEGVTKSHQAYLAELKQTQQQIDKVEQEIRDVIESANKLTYQLTGKDDAGMKVQHGLYDLIDIEYQTQKRLKEERTYLQPQWAQTVQEARTFAQRRAGLEAILSRIEKSRPKQ